MARWTEVASVEHALRAACLAAALAASPEASAAIRNIQFVGMLGADSILHSTANEQMWGNCAVAIVNTGTVDQQINSITMLPYTQSNQQTGAFASSVIEFVMSRPGQAQRTGANACTGAVLTPGGVCIARMATNTFPHDSKFLVCAGRIEVEDRPGLAPGSVTAAGTITLNQESVVLGGMLSGAFYQSGAHISQSNSAAMELHPDHPGLIGSSYENPGVTTNAGVAQMNIYCANACIRNAAGGQNNPHLNNRECAELCGYGGEGTANIHVDADDNGAPERFAWHSLGAYNITGIINPATTYGKESFSDASRNAGSVLPAIMQSANAHFAGGMVYEMNIGPMNMICSANKTFWQNGGNEFMHPDGVDNHAIIFGQDDSAPPERLFCSHRHAEEDLHLKVGSSSSFTINGGNPF